MTVHLLGIRHHGPGSARAVATALAELQPDVVLIEGPPEADKVVELAGSEEMVPPVALLAYAVDDSTRAAFWPFAVFSPEWQAVEYALAADVPVRFCDLPAAHQFASSGGDGRRGLSIDPLATLANAGGYDDPERWWDDVIESRREGAEPFTVIADAMRELRHGEEATGREAQREAYMRTVLRKAIREGFERIAVICGAWHVPASGGTVAPGNTRPTHPERPAEAEGRLHVGPVDARPAGGDERVRRRDHLTRLVSPPVHRPGPDHRTMVVEGRSGPARGRPARLQRARDRSGPARGHPGCVAGTSAGRVERGHRGDAGGALQRERRTP